MFNKNLLSVLKDDLIDKAQNHDNKFVTLCLDIDDVKMYNVVYANDFIISENYIDIDIDNFTLSVTLKSDFKIEKNKNLIETEYVLTSNNFKLYITI